MKKWKATATVLLVVSLYVDADNEDDAKRVAQTQIENQLWRDRVVNSVNEVSIKAVNEA